MRELPHMRYGDGIVKRTQVRFGGYSHSKYAKDGEIYDMKNITQNIYPLITTRDKRDICKVKAEKELYKGYVYEFTSDGKLAVERDLSGMIRYGDKIKITVSGKYAENSGEYIVNQYDDKKISILVGEFEKKSENNDTAIQPYEITITLLKRSNGGTQTDHTAVTSYSRVSQSVGTDYSYEIKDEGFTKTTVTTSTSDVYFERTTNTQRTITYKAGVRYTGVRISADNEKRFAITAAENATININNYEYAKIVIDGYGTVYIYSGYYTYGFHYFYDVNGMEPPAEAITADITVYEIQSVNNTSNSTVDKEHEYTQTASEVTTVNKAENDVFYETTTLREKWAKNITETTITEYGFYAYEPKVSAIGAGDKMYYVSGDGGFWYDNEYIGKLSEGEKSFTQTGAYIFILPDKAVFNINTKEMSVPWSDKMTQYFSQTTGFKFEIEGAKITFSSSTYEMVERMIVGRTYDVRVYTTSGNIKLTTATVQSNTGSELTFDKEIDSVSNFDIKYITISVSVPDLAYVCGANNRVWGCDDKNIYCSAFGEPEKWNYFETGAAGTADNSWSIQPFDNAGDFTGCTTERGMAVFFKENIIYKVYGSNPSNFTLEAYNIPGVMRGSSKSIVKIKDDIYYLSNEGVMRFSGGVSENISQEFYQSLSEGVGGTDGVRYFLSCNTSEGQRLFVFNTKNNTWSIEDEEKAVDFAYFMRRLYMLNDKHELININPGEHSSPIELYQKEQEPYGVIEFGDYYCDSPDKKAVSKLYFRFSTESGGSVKIEINYDSEKNEGKRVWRSVKELKSGEKKSYTLPVIPRRADHFRLRISGEKFTLYSLTHEYYNGTAM